jgi:acyl carrier protein phosphodiesterase
MNYLAHAYLSFNDPEIMLGNMISDFVKGRKKFDYPDRIHAGITLHRLIDTFTDEHPATREAKEFFRPYYRLYSGAFVDVVYDHFLANDPGEFFETSLLDFSDRVYHLLEERKQWLPVVFAGMLPYMKSQNWLYNYQSLQGTEQSFRGIVRRAAFLSESAPAGQIFREYYQPLQACYRQFWADIKPYALQQLSLLNKTGEL